MDPAVLTPLAAIPSPSQGVWYVGNVPIRAYALCIVLGIVAACAVTEVRMRRRGMPPWVVLDVAVWAVPLGIIGARIYHVITSPDAYFGKGGDPVDAFKIWHGGLGIWGGVAGGALGAWIAARRMGVPLTFIADALAPGLPLAQAIGRWGNWFNNELFGRRTSLPWGLKVYEWDTDHGKAVTDVSGHPIARAGLYQPTFLYESLWDVGVAILVWQLDKRYRFGRGRAFALYVMAYTAGRFWVEALRDDPAHHFLGMRLNDWTSIAVFVGGLVYFLRARGRQLKLVPGGDGLLQAVPWDAGPDADGVPTRLPSGEPGPAADTPDGGPAEPVAGAAAASGDGDPPDPDPDLDPDAPTGDTDPAAAESRPAGQ